MTRYLVLILLFASPAGAATVVVCDPDHASVPGKVEAVLPSAHTPDWSGNPDALINPDLSGVSSTALRYWKCSGAEVVPMTPQEQLDLDTWEAQQTLEAARVGARESLDTEILIRAVAIVTLEETNRLRQAICNLHPAACSQLPQVTPAQMRDVIRARVMELTPGGAGLEASTGPRGEVRHGGGGR